MLSKSTQRKLASHKKTSRCKISRQICLLLLKRTNWQQRRNVLSSTKGLQLIAVITPPVNSLLSWYGAVCSVLVPASVYNKSVTTQSVTKQELPKYIAEQPPLYQIDFLNRDINKKLVVKADNLIDKILSCCRFKRSISQEIVLDNVDTAVLFSDFTLNLRVKIWQHLNFFASKSHF